MAANRIAVLIVLVFGSPCSFADMIGMGNGGLIPDNNPAGLSSTIIFTAREVIVDLSVTIDFGPLVSGRSGHSHVGDLTAVLSGPHGHLSLFDRVGFPQRPFGDSSNLSGIYRWEDSGESFSAAAARVNNNTAIANGSYLPQNGNDALLSFRPVFGGTHTDGEWRLTIYDSAAADIGGFIGWKLKIRSYAIPEPSSFVVLASCWGLAGWFYIFRRQRRRSRQRHPWYRRPAYS